VYLVYNSFPQIANESCDGAKIRKKIHCA